MHRSGKSFIWVFLIALLSFARSVAQPTWTFNPFGKDQKPAEYEEKKLGSEKTADKKFTFFRKLTQNGVSHFNYFFNAKNKLNLVLERAKLSQQDDYSRLLSFYPYSLDNTLSQEVELDSVVQKCTAGILLHDLRTEWVDNMYLLIGQSYFFRKKYDSAAMTFQFINYNLFPRKKNEFDDRIIGENEGQQTSKLSIADREKRNIIQKTFTLPPSRNEALIWLARNYIESEQYGESAGLINILQEDPNLPKRLKDDLNQVTAYWYFKQHGYDSAAVYLEKGLTSAETKADKARWEFLLGQLFEMSGNFDKSGKYYQHSAKATVDPLMDIFARLNKAKMLRSNGNIKELESCISTLVKMAGKDKYETYRDIIFHSAGVLSLRKPDTSGAVQYFEKSLKLNAGNLTYKNKAHLELGKIAFDQRQYKSAADHYDSLDLADPSMKEDSASLADLKSILRNMAIQLTVIQTEDSLQMIASMPAAERDAFIKKLSKKLRKEQANGKEGEVDSDASNLLTSDFSKTSDKGADLFSTSSKGEWYFYNASLKSKGFNEFKSKWGKRENVDNWRRKAAMNAALNLNNAASVDPLAPPDAAPVADASGKPVEGSYDALMMNLPLTPESLDSSNLKIGNALIALAKIFEFELKDIQQAIYMYELYLQRFPGKSGDGEVYLGLYDCYSKIGDSDKANYYKAMLDSGFSESNFAKMLNDPASLSPEKNNPAVSRKYDEIYSLFYAGNYDSAFTKKKAADAQYGKQYWTPQLLFLEAQYYVKCGQDTTAISKFRELISSFPDSELKEKSENFIEVLKKRKSIELYLDRLTVTRIPEDSVTLVAIPKSYIPGKAAPLSGNPVKNSSDSIKKAVVVSAPADTARKVQPLSLPAGFSWKPDAKHYVLMVLDQVDFVYIRESKNAFDRYNQNYNHPSISIVKDTIDARRAILIFNSFSNATNAFSYYEEVKKAASTQVGWLNAAKYSFLIIDDENLQVLKAGKDISGYRKLLNDIYPGKF